MGINNSRIAWVHGIGNALVGYSNPWRVAFNTYLQFPDSDYIEVLWSMVDPGTIFTASLTPQELIEAVNMRKMLETTLAARRPTQALAVNTPQLREWPEIATLEAFSLPIWILDSQDYVGEFTAYLVNRGVRDAVKNKLKEQLRPLVGQNDAISVIAHSWGTVVAYESLIDLEKELPNLKLANLFTLGSPLWAVHYLLDERSGRKPHNTNTWVNVYAQGDTIGAGLKPGFQVDKDFAVLNFGNTNNPHGSYFLTGNTAVQRDIVAKIISGG